MKPQYIFYFLIGCIIVLVIGGSVAYYLSHDRFQSKIDQTERLRAEIITARERVERLENLEQSYTEIQPFEEKMNRMVPQKKKQAEVAALIFSMMNSSNVSGSSISFEQTSGAPSSQTQTTEGDVSGVRVMPVNFSVNGSYEQLQSFLRNIEQQERLMQVTSLTIQRTGDTDGLVFDIQLEVFLKNASSQED